MSQDGDHQSNVPEDFLELVKQALEHLYDFPFLQRHSLAQEMMVFKENNTETAGQILRRELVSAIEAINPGSEFFFRSSVARLFNLLQLHYIEGFTIQETANELGISTRQAYRDLKRGCEGVAEILWSKRNEMQSQEKGAIQLTSMESEVARLDLEISTARFSTLLELALRSVERLAEQHGVQVVVKAPATPVKISTNLVVAQQLLVIIFSQAIKAAKPGDIVCKITPLGDSAHIDIDYQTSVPTHELGQIALMEELSTHIGWHVAYESHAENAKISLETANTGPTILIIDDNEGLVDLLDRYLSGHACHVVSAKSGWDGLALAQDTIPDAIILDIMMPEMDGWELLQRLRAIPETAEIPVIICSVFNDPELAFSLGASLFIPKPVSRDAILDGLRELSVV